MEINLIIQQLQDAYNGDPWFGRSVKALLSEASGDIVFIKPQGQHSLLELLWHMITWREFTISRLQKEKENSLYYFEENDWRNLDHSDKTLWQQGLLRLEETQAELVELLQKQGSDLLDKKVEERDYTFRKLLNGVIQHDIYHAGQIAYIVKLLRR